MPSRRRWVSQNESYRSSEYLNPLYLGIPDGLAGRQHWVGARSWSTNSLSTISVVNGHRYCIPSHCASWTAWQLRETKIDTPNSIHRICPSNSPLANLARLPGGRSQVGRQPSVKVLSCCGKIDFHKCTPLLLGTV